MHLTIDLSTDTRQNPSEQNHTHFHIGGRQRESGFLQLVDATDEDSSADTLLPVLFSNFEVIQFGRRIIYHIDHQFGEAIFC